MPRTTVFFIITCRAHELIGADDQVVIVPVKPMAINLDVGVMCHALQLSQHTGDHGGFGKYAYALARVLPSILPISHIYMQHMTSHGAN